MNLLDENFPDDQSENLRIWKIPFRQIGKQAGYRGIKDDNIIPILHRFKSVTFFTQDQDFFRRNLCHDSYCLVWLEVDSDDAARYVRQLLRHPHFDTASKRSGKVVRVSHGGLAYWMRNVAKLQSVRW